MGPYSFFVTGGSYLAVVVDSPGFINSPARVGRDQGVEVSHRLTALFDEGTPRAANVRRSPFVRTPNHLSGVVYAHCIAFITSFEIPQILHLLGSTIVEEGMRAVEDAIPNHLVEVVYVRCNPVVASESAQVQHLSGSILIVEEGMFAIAVALRHPNYLAGVVYAPCFAVIASESAQALPIVSSCSSWCKDVRSANNTTIKFMVILANVRRKVPLVGRYLAFAVDGRGITNRPARPARVRWNQVVEILHPVGAIVEEGMLLKLLTVASVRIPHHLAGVVYVICTSVVDFSEIPQVQHLWGSTLIVKEGTSDSFASDASRRPPNHLSGVVYARCIANASESA